MESYWSLVFYTDKIINPSEYAYNKQNPTEMIALIMKEMGNPLDEILCKILNTCSDWGLCIIRD